MMHNGVMFSRFAWLVLLLAPTACVLVDPLEDDYALAPAGEGGLDGLGGDGGAPEGGGSGGVGGGGGSGGAAITVSFGERAGAEVQNVTADTQLSGYLGGQEDNWGAGEMAWVDDSSSELRVTLLRFDLGSVASDAIVESSSLSLFTLDVELADSDDPTLLYEVLEPWEEGDQIAQPGAASWNDRMTGVPWTAPGCGVGSRADEILASFTAQQIGTEYVFDLPVDLVQAWIASPSDNHGMVLLTPSLDGTGLVTSESPSAERRPMITVTYRP